MKPLTGLTREELTAFHSAAQSEYEQIKQKNLKLDMSRGKPSSAQLDISSDMLGVISKAEDCYSDGVDIRNYGILDGVPECIKLFAEIMDVPEEQVFLGGTASLTLMYDLISKAYTFGLKNSKEPWCKLDTYKFLCPAPGYDRHFKITEVFGAELITVPMTGTGPDMDMVEELVKDPLVKGVWCVPKYSNPTGVIYSDETIDRFAKLKPAAPDFVIMWDNAYSLHEFDGEYVPMKSLIRECEKAGNPDMVFEFTSTSKITFPGAGVSAMAASKANMDYMRKLMGVQLISHDKINQLRHVRYLKNKAGVIEHMKKHAKLMKPKFALVLEKLDTLNGLDIATWERPRGGYFVSLELPSGCAKRMHALAKDVGVTLTNAGATFPYGKDPNDSNIRIAPSLPPISELDVAMDVILVCSKLAAAEKLLGK